METNKYVVVGGVCIKSTSPYDKVIAVCIHEAFWNITNKNINYLSNHFTVESICALQCFIFGKISHEITTEKVRKYHLEKRRSWTRPDATEEQRKAIMGDDDEYIETEEIVSDFINSKILEYAKVARKTVGDYEISVLAVIEKEINKK